MNEFETMLQASARLGVDRRFEALLELLQWIALQPDSEEEACLKAIDQFARAHDIDPRFSPDC